MLAEIGDLSRFQNPRELMGYLGLVPSESSTGDTVNRGSITKAGNGRVRRILVESAWTYRYPPRVSREKQMKVTIYEIEDSRIIDSRSDDNCLFRDYGPLEPIKR